MQKKTGLALDNKIKSASEHDVFEVNIFLVGEPAHEVLTDDNVYDAQKPTMGYIDSIKTKCANIQSDLFTHLKEEREAFNLLDDGLSVPQVGNIETFWINNSISTELSRSMLESLLDRTDIEYIELMHRADIEELMDEEEPEPEPESSKKNNDFAKPTWNIKKVNAPLLWKKNLNGDKVVVAVVDTGVNYNHPDLQNNMWDGGEEFPHHGYDFDSNDNDPMDERGHGTSCAGIVAGNGTSGSITGVATDAAIMAIRVGGAESSFWRGIQFALDHKADVISMSMSWKYPSDPNYPGWRRLCETVLAAGVLHANSIGNQGDKLGTYPIPYNIATPGNCPPPRLHPSQNLQGDLSSAVSCGATDSNDRLAPYSGRGPAAWEEGPYRDYPYQNGAMMGLIKPDVCAPGPGTKSCNWQFPHTPQSKPYKSFGGTSAATPHVAGCMALLVQACKRSLTNVIPAQIQEALEETAVHIQGQAHEKENHFGAGRVDVYAAFQYGVARGWWA